MKAFTLSALSTLWAGLTLAHPVDLAKRGGGYSDVDITILQFALTLEHLENTFYKDAFSSFTLQQFLDAGFDEDFFLNLQFIATDESTHVELLTAAISGAGATPVKPCEYKFPVTDVPSFVTLSAILESIGTSAYLGAAPFVGSKDILAVAASIMVTEAFHTSLQRSSLGGIGAPDPFGTSLDANSVFTLAAQFIVSCPPENPPLPFTAFPGLKVDAPSCLAEDGGFTAPSGKGEVTDTAIASETYAIETAAYETAAYETAASETAAASEAATSEAAASETAAYETATSEAAASETAAYETATSEAAAYETAAASEAATSEAAASETAAYETAAASDAATSEEAASETAAYETASATATEYSSSTDQAVETPPPAYRRRSLSARTSNAAGKSVSCAAPSAGASVNLYPDFAASKHQDFSQIVTVFVTLISGLDVISIQAVFAGDGSISITIPSGIGGQVFIFITIVDVTGGKLSDSDVLFGPAIMEVAPALPSIGQ